IPPSNDNPNPDTTKTGRTEIFGNRDEDQLLEPESSWKKLTSLAVNPNRLAESYAPYRQLIACGYTPAEIHDAWLVRQAECERAGKETRYFPQLKKWLESQDLNGATAMISTEREKNTLKKRENRRLLMTLLVQDDRVFEKLYQDASAAQKLLDERGCGNQADVDNLWTRVKDYFDAHQDEVA
ncbi:MAG: hypothetical protein RSB88_09110, partial [Akkermansia sp.]